MVYCERNEFVWIGCTRKKEKKLHTYVIPNRTSLVTIEVLCNLYITKNWIVVFNVASLRLRHISCHVITILFPEFFLQFKISFLKFKNTNKKKIIPNHLCSTITILDGNPLSSMITILNSNPMCSTVTISNGNPSAS